MKYRKLRIAWSVFCGIAWLLLMALWVWSYPKGSPIYGRYAINHSFSISAHQGKLVYLNDSIGRYSGGNPRLPSPAAFSKLLAGRIYFCEQGSGYVLAAVPLSFPALLSAILAVVPWLRLPKRFSLRTLLIATTLVAVVLGLIVWLR